MKTINVLAIDLAKNVFQLHAMDKEGSTIFRKKVSRAALAELVAQTPTCIVAMEACGSSYYWGRRFHEMGHDVRLISPQFVKAFVKSNKNDRNDAEGIAIAATQKEMRFVPLKEEWQQEIQVLHRARELTLKSRLSFSNAIIGLLAEFGIILTKGGSCAGFIKKVCATLGNEDLKLGDLTKRTISSMLDQLRELHKQMNEYDREIDRLAKEREDCRRIQEIEGIGTITATAIVGSCNPKVFKNGRAFAASLGLVPRQHSTGGKNVLLGISKRGDGYVRKLLIHGARSVIIKPKEGMARRLVWAQEKVKSRGMNKACVALANKNARVIWALLARGEDYKLV